MNQHTVISSTILAAAIVGAAWLMKPIEQPIQQPIQQPCWESREGDSFGVMLNKCTGEMWTISSGKAEWSKIFTAQSKLSSASKPMRP